MYIVAGLMKEAHQARGLVRALADAAFEREEIDMAGGPVVGLVNCGIPEGEAHVFAAGDRLPVGLEVLPGYKRNDTVLWSEDKRALVFGDTLADFGNGLEMNTRWLEDVGVTRQEVTDRLSPLLELPVEHVLATHGGPFDRAALERALA